MGNKLIVFCCLDRKVLGIIFMEGNLPDEEGMKNIATTVKKKPIAPGDHYFIFSESTLSPFLQGIGWEVFKTSVSSTNPIVANMLLGIGFAAVHDESILLE